MAFTFDDDDRMTEKLVSREKVTPSRATPSRPRSPSKSYVEGFRFGGQDGNADAQRALEECERAEILDLRDEIQVERKKYDKMRKNVVRLQRRVNILEREKAELQEKLNEIERQRLAVHLAEAGLISDEFDLDRKEGVASIGCAPLRTRHRKKKKKAAASLIKSPQAIANDPLERLKTSRGIIGRTTSNAAVLMVTGTTLGGEANGVETAVAPAREVAATNGDAPAGPGAFRGGAEGEATAAVNAAAAVNEKAARELQRLREEVEDLNNFMTAVGGVFQNIRADLLVQMACSKDSHLSRLATQTLIKFAGDKEKQKELAQAGTIRLLLQKVEDAKTDKQRLAAADALELLVGNPRLQNYLIQGSEIHAMLELAKTISDVRLLDYVMGVLALCCGNPALHPTLVREGLVSLLSRIACTERVLASEQVKRKLALCFENLVLTRSNDVFVVVDEPLLWVLTEFTQRARSDDVDRSLLDIVSNLVNEDVPNRERYLRYLQSSGGDKLLADKRNSLDADIRTMADHCYKDYLRALKHFHMKPSSAS